MIVFVKIIVGWIEALYVSMILLKWYYVNEIKVYIELCLMNDINYDRWVWKWILNVMHDVWDISLNDEWYEMVIET